MFEYNTVEEAVKDLQDGKLILVSDDESRENEGDLICAAEFATTENVNFMATYGKGLICMPMSGDLCRKLGLTQMVADNTDNHETAFTVSIDHVKTTTGISAEERGFTARACVSDEAKPEDFRRPGHMFPLRSKPNGVLERNGHTEATVDLMRIAGLKECGLCCEIMKADGTMMRKEDLIEMSEKFNLKFITIKAIQEYRKRHDNLVECVAVTRMPTKYGEFMAHCYVNNGQNLPKLNPCGFIFRTILRQPPATTLPLLCPCYFHAFHVKLCISPGLKVFCQYIKVLSAYGRCYHKRSCSY